MIRLTRHGVFIFGSKIMRLLMVLLRKHVKPSKERILSSRGSQPSWKGRLLIIGRLNICFVDFLCPRTVGLYSTKTHHWYEGHKN
ncbi:uncharacterized protein CCOS01_11299 [Colletotrichum costaricense]|uniref:Uncharacterized protein n=1 Tax=Colletotrichum costaricense TaxID=1209916 RepID=A0AAI9YRA0_9PEZI|nr:uncharacterized protein CCOS01_11299 [Colletotrichum costaricense]KAK1519648.1 hypothetical protein CCOS01_11299 [Colletotrichum costaricense]